MPEERTRRVVYDIKQKKPGCALLQVALGGDLGIANYFAAETWITGNRIDGLQCYLISEAEFRQLIKLTHTHHGIKASVVGV
jgi:hypothetical protein